MENGNIANLKVTLTPIKAAIRSDGKGDLDVLLRVIAPEQATEGNQRMPLSLAVVIDRSGSMSGGKLEAAKACALDLVKRLQPEDEVSVVVYDDAVEVLLPLAARNVARDKLAALLAAVSEGGSTDLHGGWLKGAQQLAPRTAANRMCRVILLSDGQANHGETAADRICEQVKLLAQSGVSTTTVGLGEGFNESLMTAMAVAGQGSALYGDRAEDLAEPFDAEISLLSHLAWRDVRLVAGSATSRWKLRSDYAKNAEGAWSLPAIANATEAWAVFSVPMESAARAQTRSRQGMALHVTVTARDKDGRQTEVKASLPPLPLVSADAWSAMPADELVCRRVAEVRVANLQNRAREAVGRQDWDEAERLLKKVEVLATDQPWLQETLAQMRRLASQRDHVRMSKELAYASFSMTRRLTEIDEGGAYQSDTESAKRVYLRRKELQGRGGPV